MRENSICREKPARTFQDLVVWRKAHQFVLAVYKLTEESPKQETYSLVSQMRRAAVSIPANIAEGFRKRSRVDKARFMNIAEGSLEESYYYLILAQEFRIREDRADEKRLGRSQPPAQRLFQGAPNSS